MTIRTDRRSRASMILPPRYSQADITIAGHRRPPAPAYRSARRSGTPSHRVRSLSWNGMQCKFILHIAGREQRKQLLLELTDQLAIAEAQRGIRMRLGKLHRAPAAGCSSALPAPAPALVGCEGRKIQRRRSAPCEGCTESMDAPGLTRHRRITTWRPIASAGTLSSSIKPSQEDRSCR